MYDHIYCIVYAVKIITLILHYLWTMQGAFVHFNNSIFIKLREEILSLNYPIEFPNLKNLSWDYGK